MGPVEYTNPFSLRHRHAHLHLYRSRVGYAHGHAYFNPHAHLYLQSFLHADLDLHLGPFFHGYPHARVAHRHFYLDGHGYPDPNGDHFAVNDFHPHPDQYPPVFSRASIGDVADGLFPTVGTTRTGLTGTSISLISSGASSPGIFPFPALIHWRKSVWRCCRPT